MIKDALRYLVGLGQANQHEINGQAYSDKDLALIAEPTANAIQIANLTGVVDYIKTNYDGQPPVMVHVESPTRVSVISTFNRDKKRDRLVMAEALNPKIPFGQFVDTESFNILLQSCFVDDADRAALLAATAHIVDEEGITMSDDGVTQRATMKTGVAQLGVANLPNPVRLKPFRTFVEVEQPESAFVFRMRKGAKGVDTALFEADGGEWRNAAIHAIRDYLNRELAEQIAAKQAFIIA